MKSFFSRDRSRMLIVMAALLWSTSGFFAKAPWFDTWPEESRGVALTFWRSVFAAITVLPFIRRPEFRLAMVPMSLSFTAMTYTFLVAMVAGSETTTIWLQYVGPAWVALAGWFGLGDRPRRSDAVMVGWALLGISTIVLMESMYGPQAGAGVLWGPVGLALLSGLMYTGVILSLRHLRGVDVAWLGFVNHFVSCLLLAPLVIGKVPIPEGVQWLALMFFGSVQLAIPYMIFAWAIRDVESNEASLITLIEPLAVPMWVFIAWRHHPSYELPNWWTLVGALFIATGFVWRYGIAKRNKG